MNDEYLLSLGVNAIESITTNEKLLLLETVATLSNFEKLSLKDIESIIKRKRKPGHFLPSEILERVFKEAKLLEKKGISVLQFRDICYPPQLKQIWDPPFILYYTGNLPDNSVPMMGIVGTRYPSGGGKRAAFRLGFEFADFGIGTVSGLARGIDGEVHNGTIRGGGYTCAVLGCGNDIIYPRDHRGLAREILDNGGLILSEYPPGTPPLKYHFPQRNRIISGLSRGVCIIEAPEKSGALITADFALDMGRDLYVHEAGMENTGGKRLVFYGARLISSANDILKDWGFTMPERGGSLREEKETALDAGARLAQLLEKELSGEILFHQGEGIRRY